MKMDYICPYCGTRISLAEGEDGACSSCGKHFSPSDWPEEAYSSDGLQAVISFISKDYSWSSSSLVFLIGRDPGRNGFLINNPYVSREHARVVFANDSWKIRRLGSAELRCNDIAVDEKVLNNNDTIQIGPFKFDTKISFVQVPKDPLENAILELPKTSALEISKERITIGSDKQNCDIVITGIAPKHALVYQQSGTKEWWIVDCASKSGTKVNGKQIWNERLFNGDEITIGGVSMYFTDTQILFQEFPRGLSLELEKVSATVQGKELLKDVDFKVLPGEFIGILGPSGCGKSSLIQRIFGLSEFDSGKMLVNGKDVNEFRDSFQRSISYIPQQISLHDNLTLKEEFDCFCRLQDTGGYHDFNSAQPVIKLLGLEDERDRQILKLSGGQKRRISIALELLRNPQLLLLDEPTSGLDPASEKNVMTYLRRVANQKRTVICSTHIMENIGLFDKILVLSQGYQVFFGTPHELKNYLNISSSMELYDRLGNGDKDEQVRFARKLHEKYTQTFPKTHQPGNSKPLPQPKSNSFLKQIGGYLYRQFYKQIGGYLYRQFYEFISFRHSHSKSNGSPDKSEGFFQSSVFIQLILQPLLIALVIRWTYAKAFSAVGGTQAYMYIDRLFFFCSVVVFWLGLNNSIRELVHERIPGRCLERRAMISMSNYLTAKVAWTIGMCLVQTLLFSVFLCIPLFKTCVPNAASYNPLSLSILLVLFLPCIVGGLTGLAISAIFKKEDGAVGLLPIIMVPIFFFSVPVIENENFQFTHPDSCICTECKRSQNRNDTGNVPMPEGFIRKLLPSYLRPELPSTDEISEAKYNRYAPYPETINPCVTPQMLMTFLHQEDQRLREKDESKREKDESKREKEMNSKMERNDDTNKMELRYRWKRTLTVLGFWSSIALVLMCIFQSKNEKAWDGRN